MSLTVSPYSAPLQEGDKQARTVPMRNRLSDGSTIDFEVRTVTICTVVLHSAADEDRFRRMSEAERDEVRRLARAVAEQGSF